MNTATQNLENDHVHILRLTDIMLEMVEQKCTETDHFELVVNLIRKFADGLHHAKEEELLFPLLGEKGFSPEQGPVAVMLMEHVQGRNFVKGISDGIVELKKGKSGAIQLVYENLSGYAILLQNHISKENNILFRMADRTHPTRPVLPQSFFVDKLRQQIFDFRSFGVVDIIDDVA